MASGASASPASRQPAQECASKHFLIVIHSSRPQAAVTTQDNLLTTNRPKDQPPPLPLAGSRVDTLVIHVSCPGDLRTLTRYSAR